MKSEIYNEYHSYKTAQNFDEKMFVLKILQEKASQSIHNLQLLLTIFSDESDDMCKVDLASILLKLKQYAIVEPYLLRIARSKISPTNNTFEMLAKLHAATLLTSINHPDGIQVLQELTEKQAQGVLGDFNIYNELEDLIPDKTNSYIKDVIKAAAYKYDGARSFYEYFYNEKIEKQEEA